MPWSALRLASPVHRVCKPPPALLVRFVATQQPPRDEQIRLERVRLVNTEGKLNPPTPLSEVLNSIDRKKFYVRLISKEEGIVKIISNREDYLRGKAMRKAARAAVRASEVKEIQMTWGVAVGDLEYKLKKVQREMQKGYRVTFIFAPKKRTPLPPPEEREAKVKEVMDFIGGFATEWQPRTFERGVMTLHLEPSPSITELNKEASATQPDKGTNTDS